MINLRQPSKIAEDLCRLQERIFEEEHRHKKEIDRLLHIKKLYNAELVLARDRWGGPT